jgi:hypothetical protein
MFGRFQRMRGCPQVTVHRNDGTITEARTCWNEKMSRNSSRELVAADYINLELFLDYSSLR